MLFAKRSLLVASWLIITTVSKIKISVSALMPWVILSCKTINCCYFIKTLFCSVINWISPFKTWTLIAPFVLCGLSSALECNPMSTILRVSDLKIVTAFRSFFNQVSSPFIVPWRNSNLNLTKVQSKFDRHSDVEDWVHLISFPWSGWFVLSLTINSDVVSSA